MSKISERFLESMKEKGLKNVDIAKKYNISRQLVNNFFTSQKTLTLKLTDICNGENINLNWLVTGKGEMFLKDETFLINENISSAPQTDDQVSLNFYEDICASAGYGATNTNILPSKIKFDKSFLKSFLNIHDFKDLDIIRVTGDSMLPSIKDGEYIIVQKTTNIKNGDTIIANIQGEIYVKRYQKIPFQNFITLESENEIYPTIKIDTQEKLDQLNIIGVVKSKIKGGFDS